MNRLLSSLSSCCTIRLCGGRPRTFFQRLFSRAFIILALACLGTSPLHALTRAALVAQSTPLGNQWYHLEWFGYYWIDGSPSATAGEIIHNEHGRLYVHDNTHSQAGSGFWIVDDLGMNATWRLHQAEYPDAIWRFMPLPANGHLLSYMVGSAPAREFFNNTTGATEYHPVTPTYTSFGPHGPVPVWWKQMGLVDLTKSSDHFAPLLVGQLKHVATGAKNYLDSRFGLTSQDWNNAYTAFGAPNPFPFDQTSTGSNHAPVTIGQLKFVASGFYKILADFAPEYEVNDRLTELGFPSANLRNQPPYLPWTGDGASPANKAVATLGQLKMAFSFDLDRGLYLGQPWVPMVAMSSFIAPSVGTIPPRPAASTFTIVDYSVDTWAQFFASERSTANQNWFRSHWSGTCGHLHLLNFCHWAGIVLVGPGMMSTFGCTFQSACPVMPNTCGTTTASNGFGLIPVGHPVSKICVGFTAISLSLGFTISAALTTMAGGSGQITRPATSTGFGFPIWAMPMAMASPIFGSISWDWISSIPAMRLWTGMATFSVLG